jgi:Laminin G domain
MKRSLLLSLAGLLSASLCFAGKNTDLKPASAKPGKVMFEDSLEGSALGKTWEVKKGAWQAADGKVTGVIKKEENHAAVLFLNVPNHNSIIRFSFQLTGSKGLALSYNSSKGHLFRIGITPEGLAVTKDRDKKDEKSKNESLAKASAKFSPGEWHTILVEVKAGKVTVQTDNGAMADVDTGALSELDVGKTGYRFVTGDSAQIADVKVWQAE